jgi:8-oxo-dGTP pyrophosphatase MutT (NUDIX family)
VTENSDRRQSVRPELSFGVDLRHRVERNLSFFSRRALENECLSPAVVAIVLVPCATVSEACVLLTLRANTLRRHGGQYGLPGGRLDPGETASEAVTRELREELRLEISRRDLLGALDDYPTRSGFRITPFVAWAADISEIYPDPAEIVQLFSVPLSEIDGAALPEPASFAGTDAPLIAIALPSLGNSVYAPTGAILYQFREVALQGRCTRVAHFEQPKFAHR